MKFILGKKLQMSQLFEEDGKVIPVTLVEVEPCTIVQKKSQEKDGYCAVQVGSGFKKKLTKPLEGHLKGLDKFRYLREFRLDDYQEDEVKKIKRGDKIDVSVFKEGDTVKVTGVSKGKGFQGVVKRHGFHGAPASHGTKHNLRAPGSIGSAFPQRVWPGKKMAGRMGSDQITLKRVPIIKINPEKNLLFLKGAVPGRRGSLLKISSL